MKLTIEKRIIELAVVTFLCATMANAADAPGQTTATIVSAPPGTGAAIQSGASNASNVGRALKGIVDAGNLHIINGEAATRGQIINSVYRNSEQLGSSQYYIFYFSGSYWMDSFAAELYLLTADATEPDLSLPFDELLRALDRITARKLVILDLVRYEPRARLPSAPMLSIGGSARVAAKSSRSNTAIQPVISNSITEKIRQSARNENTVFLISTRDTSSIDAGVNTAFTNAVVNALSPRGSNPGNADTNRDGQLSVVELASFVQQQTAPVSQYAASSITFESGFGNRPSNWILISDYETTKSDYVKLIDPSLDFILSSELGHDKYRQLYRMLEGDTGASSLEQKVADETRNKVLELAINRAEPSNEQNQLSLTQEQRIIVGEIARLLNLVTTSEKR